MLRPLVSSPDLVDQAYQAVLEDICSGALAPGERFTQEALAARLGVSRQPVIQALLLLRRQGLIHDTENRRGVVVAPLDARFVLHLYALRAALDGAAARGAALCCNAEMAARGRSLVERGRRLSGNGARDALGALDMAFHLFLYEAAGNPLLLDAARVNAHHSRRVMSVYGRDREFPAAQIWNQHAAILDAVIAGDTDTAERLSRSHAEGSALRAWALADLEQSSSAAAEIAATDVHPVRAIAARADPFAQRTRRRT